MIVRGILVPLSCNYKGINVSTYVRERIIAYIPKLTHVDM